MPQDPPPSSHSTENNQENLILNNTFNFNEENSSSFILNGGSGKVRKMMTPSGAKNVLTNRKVLAEKTPNHSKRLCDCVYLCTYFIIIHS